MAVTAPTMSLIINTTDRSRPLLTLLQALEHQAYPEFEVIVVVGPTQDDTLDVLSEYEGRVRVLRCPEANLSRSRNLGLLAARGEIVAYIDDDAVPCQRWLEQLARLFEDPRLDATGGIVYMVHPERPVVQHRIGIFSSLAEQVDVRSSKLDSVVPPGTACQWVERMMGANMAFRRRSLLDIGGFDEFFVYIAEEADVALRLAQAGKIIHPVQEAVVYHVPASSRHRIVFSDVGKFWWLATRSQVYFSIKNGPAAGDSWRSIVLRCLHLVHGHWLAFGQLRREGKVTSFQAFWMGVNEIRGAVSGVIGGLFLPRKLISPSSRTSMLNSSQPIERFQNSRSIQQPSVDPVRGLRPVISLPDPPLRICLLSSTYPPAQYDGVGRLTNLMARGLSECGHTVHVITSGDMERVAFYDGAYVHQIPYQTNRYPLYQRFRHLYHTLNRSHAVYQKVQRLILNDGIQIVDSPLWLCEGLVTVVSGIVPVVVRLVTAVRQVSAIHQNRDEDARLSGEMEGLLIGHAAHVFPNTQATLDAVWKAYGVPIEDGRFTIVPYGIVPAPDEAVRPFDLKRESDTFTVLFVGRLEGRKGILDLFDAIPRVLKQIPHAKFVIAGGDNSEWDGFKHRTGIDYPTYFASRYGKFASHVTFTGAVSDEILQSLYQSCDVFVAPSLYESFGLIYLEAMNYAKPVIGCRTGGVSEVVDHGVTGLLVDPGAPAALAEAIASLVKSPAHLREMGMAGRQQVLDKFNHILMARNFARVYRSVIQTFQAGS